jgi:hypothetical protein
MAGFFVDGAKSSGIIETEHFLNSSPAAAQG